MVELRDVTIGYQGRTLASGLSFVFEPGSLNAVTGRNGAGKSTLLRVIAGLEPTLAGQVLVSQESLVISQESGYARGDFRPATRLQRADDFARKVGKPDAAGFARLVSYVSTERPRVPNLRVEELAALGRMPHTDRSGRLTQHDKTIVRNALSEVGMSDFAHRQTDTLSDGELQRVMIARALAQNTPTIILDEPTAFLDFIARRETVQLLRKLAHQQGKTVIFSSHELDLVNEFADKKLEL